MMNHPPNSEPFPHAEWVEYPVPQTEPVELKPKTVDESRDFLKVPSYPERINELGHMKAGHVLKLIDLAGSLSAKRHVGGTNVVVTASLDRTNFINPIRRWEFITLESRLTKAWKSSMEAQVMVSAWNFNTDETRPIAIAYLVFVALDQNRRKIPVPPLLETSDEDIWLGQAAELRKQIRSQEAKNVPIIPIEDDADNPCIVEQLMTPNESNASNNVFGGVILNIIDEAGTMAAQRQTLGGTVVGVRQDRMSFIAPAFIGETIKAKAIVTNTWRTSMEVQVEVESHNPETGQIRLIASSYLVYVRLGPEGRPADVPPWIPKTENQQLRLEDANVRRLNRLEEEKQANSPEFLSNLKKPNWLSAFINRLK